MPRVRDTVLLTGWLFADLLLALMVIFFAAVPGAPPPPPPVLTTDVTSLDAKSTACKGAISNFSCTVMLGETAKSSSGVDWSIDIAFGSTVTFGSSKGHLSP